MVNVLHGLVFKCARKCVFVPHSHIYTQAGTNINQTPRYYESKNLLSGWLVWLSASFGQTYYSLCQVKLLLVTLKPLH